MHPDYASPIARRWSKLAIASSVFAAASPVALPTVAFEPNVTIATIAIFAPPSAALIVGIWSITLIRNSASTLRGTSFAIAGIIAAAAWLGILIWLFFFQHL